MTENLLTFEEVAARLGIKPDTLSRWVAAGDFGEVLRRGSKWVRIRESQLDAFIAKSAVSALPRRATKEYRPRKARRS